jgi:hypothetical protein
VQGCPRGLSACDYLPARRKREHRAICAPSCVINAPPLGLWGTGDHGRGYHDELDGGAATWYSKRNTTVYFTVNLIWLTHQVLMAARRQGNLSSRRFGCLYWSSIAAKFPTVHVPNRNGVTEGEC